MAATSCGVFETQRCEAASSFHRFLPRRENSAKIKSREVGTTQSRTCETMNPVTAGDWTVTSCLHKQELFLYHKDRESTITEQIYERKMCLHKVNTQYGYKPDAYGRRLHYIPNTFPILHISLTSHVRSPYVNLVTLIVCLRLGFVFILVALSL